MSREFTAFFLGVQTIQLALWLILGYRFLELMKEIFTYIKKLIDDIREDEA